MVSFLCEFQREIEAFEQLTSTAQPDFDMCDSDDPLDMFRSAVATLTTKGNVESYMKPIVAKLKNGNYDIAVIDEMVDILFSHVRYYHLDILAAYSYCIDLNVL